MTAEMIDGPTIPQLARKRGIPRATLFRRLMALHARDRATKGDQFVPWLYRYEAGPWRVNLPRLKSAHPELFEAPNAEELQARVVRLERSNDIMRAKVRALIERVNRIDPPPSETRLAAAHDGSPEAYIGVGVQQDGSSGAPGTSPRRRAG